MRPGPFNPKQDVYIDGNIEDVSDWLAISGRPAIGWKEMGDLEQISVYYDKV